MKTYRTKATQVTAVEFKYSAESLAELNEWMGDSMGTSGKQRHPGAIGWVQIRPLISGASLGLAIEGNFILQDSFGEFRALSAAEFHAQFEPEPELKTKTCTNKVDGSCPLPNIHCNYPACEEV
jgi:hypothetical protein